MTARIIKATQWAWLSTLLLAIALYVGPDSGWFFWLAVVAGAAFARQWFAYERTQR